MFSKYLNRLLISLGLLSASMIAYQLSLMHYLSIVQWYHFAYMVIAIALLGFGAAGSFLALFRAHLIRNSAFLLPLFMILSALFMPLGIWLSSQEFAGFDTYLLFVEQREIWRLLLFELLFFIPFFFCALAIGLTFTLYTENIGLLYFSNLIGSGLGGILALWLFWQATPVEIPFLTGLLALLASLLLLHGKAGKWLIGLQVPLVIVLVYSIIDSPLNLNISQYKSLSRSLNLPNTEIRASTNSPHGWVQYVTSPVMRYAPGLSLSYTGKVPLINSVYNNANWAGPILKNSEDSKILDHTTSALPLEISEPEKVLVLNAGTGILSHYFVQKNLKEIDHVEQNPLITEFAQRETSYGPQVKFHFQDSRSFLAENRGKYDLIVLPDIGAFGGTAGLNALQEDYLLTLEGLDLCFESLNENGILSITVWLDYPYRNPLKITSSLVSTLLGRGINRPQDHLIAVRSWNNITYCAKNTVFESSEIQRLSNFSARLSFDPFIFPEIRPDERNRYNALEDESLFRLTDELLKGDRKKLYENYDFNIAPATDDRPYFSQFLKWRNFTRLQEIFGSQSASFLELGYLIVGVTFLQSLILSIVLVLLPLFLLKRKFNKRIWTILYFSGLGIGFMFVEIVLIQRFILLLGNPVYSVAAVISVLLFMSGLGSRYSSQISTGLKEVKKILLLIGGILVLYTFSLPWLLGLAQGSGIWVKVIISLLLIGLPAFFMGMPFPLGLKYLSKKNEHTVPWAWGINGCLSVISTSLATIIAIEAGFTILLALAVLAYLLSFGSCYLRSKINR